MKGRRRLLLGVLCLILSGLLVAPALAQIKEGKTKAGPWESFKAGKEKLLQGLKLSPEKEQAFKAVDEKFAKERKEIFASLKKDYDELEKVLATAKPEEAKVKELVGSITATQDRLFNTFKSQRSEELALLTPEQQGRYLLGMRKLYYEHGGMAPKAEGGKAGAKAPEKK